MRITVDQSVPTEVADIVDHSLRRWNAVLPRWIDTVRIGCFEAGDGVDQLAVVVRSEYRYMEITVYAKFLTLTPEERSRAVLHELCHATLGPLADLIEDLIKSCLEKGSPARKIMDLQMTRAIEGAVEDMALAVLRAPSGEFWTLSKEDAA